VKSQNRFRYILRMSGGYDVALSRALRGTTAKLRAANAARFAASIESISSHLNMVPDMRYEFDVSQDRLASLGRDHGAALPDALREQVLAYGGTLQ
jgi:hypothetical protein